MENSKENMKTKLKNISIVLVSMIAIFIVAMSFTFVLTNTDKIFAEELTEHSILDFNQQAKELNSNNYVAYNSSYGDLTFENNSVNIKNKQLSTSNYMYGVQSKENITYYANHKYILMVDIVSNHNFNTSVGIESNVNYNKGNVRKYGDNTYYEMFTQETTDTSRKLLIYLGNNYGNSLSNQYTLSNLMIIDLTQMFGVGNELSTIEEIKSYLPLNYYKYTTSNLVSLSYLDGYNNGAFAMQDGYTFDVVATDFVNNAYPISVASSTDFSKQNNAILFSGVIGINTKYTLIANDYIIMDIQSLGDGVFDICVQNNNGGYDVLQHIVSTELPNSETSGSGYTYYSGTITIKLPTDVNTIIFDGTAMLSVVDVKYKTFNLSQAIVDAYQSGVDSIDITSIRQQAYQNGLQEGLSRNANNLVGGGMEFVSTTFHSLGELFTIEIMPNVQLWVLIAIPMMFMLIGLLFKMSGDR